MEYRKQWHKPSLTGETENRMEKAETMLFSIYDIRFLIDLWLKTSVNQCESMSDRMLFEKTKPICSFRVLRTAYCIFVLSFL